MNQTLGITNGHLPGLPMEASLSCQTVAWCNVGFRADGAKTILGDKLIPNIEVLRLASGPLFTLSCKDVGVCTFYNICSRLVRTMLFSAPKYC